MGRLTAALLATLWVAAACGGGSTEPSAGPTTGSAPAPDGTRRGGDPGVDAVAELTDFRCAPDDAGRWKAAGVITNPTERVASYAVTVVVSGADARDVEGKRRILPAPPGDPRPFAIGNVPVGAGVGPTCSVRVVRLR